MIVLLKLIYIFGVWHLLLKLFHLLQVNKGLPLTNFLWKIQQPTAAMRTGGKELMMFIRMLQATMSQKLSPRLGATTKKMRLDMMKDGVMWRSQMTMTTIRTLTKFLPKTALKVRNPFINSWIILWASASLYLPCCCCWCCCGPCCWYLPCPDGCWVDGVALLV